eukprot:s3746_g4.t1
MHHAIEPWMAQVGDTEKRGLLRLMRMAHTQPGGIPVDKPRRPSWIPNCATQKKDFSSLPTAGLRLRLSFQSTEGSSSTAQHDAKICLQSCASLSHAKRLALSRISPRD